MPRKQQTAGGPKTPRDLAQGIAADKAARSPIDRERVRRDSRHAVRSADRLLKDMDDVLKRLDRKADQPPKA